MRLADTNFPSKKNFEVENFQHLIILEWKLGFKLAIVVVLGTVVGGPLGYWF
jgi:Tfp pilus assembly protein PilO